MKRLFIAASLALALPLAACNTVPTEMVSKKAAQARISANTIYTSASKLGLAAVQNGLLDKAEYQRRDAQAYAVLLKVRLGQATLEQLTASAAAIVRSN